MSSTRAGWSIPTLALAPTPRGIGVAVLAGGCGVLWRVIGLREVLLLAVFFAAAVLTAMIGVGVSTLLARPRVRISAPMPTPAVGETADVVLQVRHRFRVQLPVTLCFSVEPGDRSGTRSTSSRWRNRGVVEVEAGPGSGSGVPIELRGRRRGPGALIVDSVTVTDPLGLARCRIPAHARASFLVLPAFLSATEMPAALVGPGARGSREASGEPGGNLRDYREGDPIRQVHWKQSARQGRLLVNIPESGLGQRRSIALITDADAYPGARGDAAFELAISVAATLVSQWHGAGDEVLLGVGSDPTCDAEVHSVGRALRTLALLQLATEASTGPRREAGEPASIVITGTLTGHLSAELERSDPGILVLTEADPNHTAGPGSLGEWMSLRVVRGDGHA